MVCCDTCGCCTYPHGRTKVNIAAVLMAVAAFSVSLFSVSTYGILLGVAPVAILSSTSCTQIPKCALVTAGVFALIAAAVQLLFGSVLAQGDTASLCYDAYGNATDDGAAETLKVCEDVLNYMSVMCIVSGVTWVPAGVLAFMIPEAAPVQATVTQVVGPTTEYSKMEGDMES